MMYFGTYERNLDEKGRLQLPSRLIGESEETYTLIKALDGCMSIYDSKGFEKFLEKLSNLDTFDPDTLAFVRMTTASISPLKYDPHGRLLFPKELLRAYGIGTKVTIIGVLDHFEVWDTEAYVRYSLKSSLQYENYARNLKRNG